MPSMLESRYGCTAVIMGDVIVVMGGYTGIVRTVAYPMLAQDTCNAYLKTVEYHVLGQDTWNRLPPMHWGREGATACVKA